MTLENLLKIKQLHIELADQSEFDGVSALYCLV